MADIELVIKVDERDVELVRKNFKPTGYSFIPTCIQTEFVSAILNSPPLPKGHGRLIDVDELKKVFDERITYLYALDKKDNPSRETKICATNWCANMIDELPTIIEADKESEE